MSADQSQNSNNPLLENSILPDNAIAFSKIKNEHFLPAIDAGVEMAKKNLAQLKADTSPANFENTILALETCSEVLDHVNVIFSNLEIANGNDEMMQMAPTIYQKMSAFASDINLDPDIFKRVEAVYKNQEGLNPEQKKLLEKTYKGFVRNGARLDSEQKEKLRQIDHELAALAPKFSENVLKATNAFELWITDKKDLEGLPEGAIEAAHMAATQKGHADRWLFTLQFPSYLPFLTYAKNRSLREKLWRAGGSKAFNDAFDNQSLIKKIVQLRFDRAQILGFKNYAEFVLAERMAQTPQTVEHFLENILKASKPAAEKDLTELKKYAQDLDGLKDFKPWDFSYYSEKLKESKYAFNEEDLRPYFKLENVVEGVFIHARKLYGLTFRENTKAEPYHPEVKVYDIIEEKTGKYIGLFYTDFFPRETKKGGAWMTSFREQGLYQGKIRRPHVSIVCNFTKPTTTKPSLLSYDEVRTLFHEFGHALHGMLSECTYRSLSGTNVYWDFVELPSQIMENWVAEKEGLDLFAKHFETGESIPAELVEKLKKSHKFQAGWASLRQVQFAIMDMKWFSTNPQQISDVDSFETQATQEARLLQKIPGTNVSCSFSHIFAGGYSAGYYSYKWAEVLDADAFEYFKEKGIFNTEVADKFKNFILSKGGSEHPMDLYKKFRGREPDETALLRRDGLI